MKTKSFKVRVTADVTMSADVIVKAKSEDAAIEMALELARSGDSKVKFEVNEGNPVDPYIGNDDDVEEVKE